MTRRAHLVGSYPAPDTKSAMTMMHATLGPWLKTVPDGETIDNRATWVIPIIRERERHPELKTRKTFIYEGAHQFHPWHVAVITGQPSVESMCLHYAQYALNALPIFDELATLEQRLQVGIPAPFDLCVMSSMYTHYAIECAAAVVEIEKICELAGNRVTFQLEICLETVITARLPKTLRHKAAIRFGRMVRNFILQCPVDSQWILHLCVGDPHGQPVAVLKDTQPLVTLANELIAHWPRNRELDVIHFPFASGTHAASNDANYYWPLKHMWLPETVTPIAGIVTEHGSVKDSARILKILGPRWGVSTPCGMGRRPNAVVPILEKLAILAQS
jgi:hypothetical protein